MISSHVASLPDMSQSHKFSLCPPKQEIPESPWKGVCPSTYTPVAGSPPLPAYVGMRNQWKKCNDNPDCCAFSQVGTHLDAHLVNSETGQEYRLGTCGTWEYQDSPWKSCQKQGRGTSADLGLAAQRLAADFRKQAAPAPAAPAPASTPTGASLGLVFSIRVATSVSRDLEDPCSGVRLIPKPVIKHAGQDCWNLDDDTLKYMRGSSSPFGQHYTFAVWVYWRSNALHYRVLVRGYSGECPIAAHRNDLGMLKVPVAFVDSGYDISSDLTTWPLVIVTGLSAGLTFYTAAEGAVRVQQRGTSNHALSDRDFIKSVGLEGHGHGKIAAVHHFNRILTEPQMNRLLATGVGAVAQDATCEEAAKNQAYARRHAYEKEAQEVESARENAFEARKAAGKAEALEICMARFRPEQLEAVAIEKEKDKAEAAWKRAVEDIVMGATATGWVEKAQETADKVEGTALYKAQQHDRRVMNDIVLAKRRVHDALQSLHISCDGGEHMKRDA